MAYENIELPSKNLTGDRTNSNFYYFNNGVMYAKQRGSPHSLVASYPTDRYIGEVVCVQFDGVFYWTMEKQTDGFVIQKWELVSGILRWRISFGYSSVVGFNYDSDCFAVEYYSDSLTSGASSGVSSIDVSDGSIFNIGDIIVLGPSTVPAYTDKYESAIVFSKTGNTLNLSTSLVYSFSSSDEVYTTRYFYVFNKYSPYDDDRGSALKFEWDTGNLYSYSSNHLFGGVKAACFYDNKITFVKGNEVIQVSPSSMNVYKHFAIDNLDTDRAHIVDTYAMWVYSDVVYRLQDKYVFWNVGFGWDEESWTPYYNYVTEPFHTLVTSTVYFVEVLASPDIIHAVDVGVTEATSNIKVTVLDQARQPLNGRAVLMSSSVGTLVPNNGTTVSGGVFT
ncbi:MAG: Ig-like domain-containing protein [Candidatus Peribacteraceae bacterium]|nr:Ig-like domain-containing protein [Candidatus Peribacteraceae bacterium]